MTATHTTDLRTGMSPWALRDSRGPGAEALPGDVKTDVLVVGAGISGAMIAQALAEAGREVVVIDRRGAARGSTIASTALLQYELDTPMTKLARQRGREATRRIWTRSKLAVDAIRERARRLGFDDELTERASLYLAGDVLDGDALAAEHAERARAGFEVEFLDRKTLRARFGIEREAAILGMGNLECDPRRLAFAFLRDALARGARFFAPVELADYVCGRDGVRAQTSDGRTIKAKKMVFASGYETPKGLPASAHSIVSTWAIATRPQPRALWPTQCLIWEASDPYLYLRADPDGRIICGGEDEEFSDADQRDALLPEKTRRLEKKLAALMPHVDARAELAWCGSFGASDDGAPSIGRAPRQPGVYACLGYGGNGTTFSMMASQMIAADIAGRPDPDAKLFRFRRQV
jgi:glycine/D-amino acid oxidase-like deaminating enzyme